MFDRRGTILKHVRIGHAQTASVGKFLPDRPGLQLMCVNFWKNPGIVSLFDHDGNLLDQQEPIHSGSPMLPVNWRGDGQEFVLLSGNAREGGMIDGKMRRVVMFPDDGHPDLAAYVANLTGDARDEVILWDQERVWIYTQDRPFSGERIYAPRPQPRLQRVELPHGGLASGLGRVGPESAPTWHEITRWTLPSQPLVKEASRETTLQPADFSRVVGPGGGLPGDAARGARRREGRAARDV